MNAERIVRSSLAVTGLVVALSVGVTHAAVADGAVVIELNQTPCQFLESENGIDRGFRSGKQADCEVINDRTGKARLAESKALKLKPGKYVFRVTNKNVPYDLGFWLRGASLIGRATLPSASGGGLITGGTKDYEIELVEGEYVYSCPLNPTPDYRLVVEG
jgi:hypothetical protein